VHYYDDDDDDGQVKYTRSMLPTRPECNFFLSFSFIAAIRVRIRASFNMFVSPPTTVYEHFICSSSSE